MRNHPHVQQYQMIKILRHSLQIVMDDQAGFAGRPQVLEEPDDGLLGGGIHRRKGLVHQIKISLLNQSAGEKRALLLATGELADLTVSEVRDAHAFQGVSGELAMPTAHRFEPADPSVATHRHHIERTDREIPVHTFALWDVADPVALLPIGLPKDPHAAGRTRDQVHDRLDQGAFSGAIWSDDPHQFARWHIQIDVPQHRLTMVGHRHIVNR